MENIGKIADYYLRLLFGQKLFYPSVKEGGRVLNTSPVPKCSYDYDLCTHQIEPTTPVYNIYLVHNDKRVHNGVSLAISLLLRDFKR